MIYKVYITRTVTEHLHVIVDAPDWEEAMTKANDRQWIRKEDPFEVHCHNLESHGAKRIDPLEELNMASKQSAE